MSLTPSYEVSKRRQMVAGVATAVTLIGVIALARGAGAVAGAAVFAAAAASALASPSLRTAAANFVVGAGVFGTVAVLIANEGMPSGNGRLLLLVAVVPPVGALVGSAFFAAGRVEREPGLEFERHLLARAASTAFAATALVALALTIVDVVSAAPAPPPVVYLFVSVNAFVFALMTERRRMS